LRFRTKLLITGLTAGLLTNGTSLGLMYYLSRSYLYDGYRAKMLSITASVATMLDGDVFKTIRTRADENTPQYKEIDRLLRDTRNANRRKDTHMERVFTVRRAEQDPKVLLFVVDPEESMEHAGHAGEVYRGGTSDGLDIEHPTVETKYMTDEFGTWLRSYAPIHDSSGKIVGGVVVESPIDWVQGKMRPIAESALGVLALVVVLIVTGVFVLSRRVSRPLAQLHKAVEAIGQGNFETRLETKSQDEFGAVAKAVNKMAAELSERERVKAAFARYVSQQVVDSILDSDAGVKLSGDRRRISVLFCDIRGFTTISENLPPEKVVQLLNEYFECMVEVVFRNKGTLDKFIGDGMMVIFGAPEDDPYQEEHALKAAIEMQAELQKLADKWRPEGLNLRIGIGINSGPAIVGNIGSSRRMEYTAIGDTVNLASRLESATKELGVGILLSEYTHNALRGSFRFKNMGSVHVKGRNEPVLTYSIDVSDTQSSATA
jgi:adenylate cyclase